MLPFSKNSFQSATFEWPKDAFNGRSVYVIKSNPTDPTLQLGGDIV